MMSRFPPALSFSDTPELRRLFETLASSDKPVTIVCGAGVSLDAGLPNWTDLVTAMLKEADTGYLAWLMADDMDLTRKVSTLEALVPDHTSMDDVLRRALYKGVVGPASPGLLARSIARYAVPRRRKAAGTAIRIATTNFDDLLERAVYAESRRKSEALGIKDSALWRSDPTRHILHLHGAIPSDGSQSRIGEIVLSEADFFRHGDQVRKELVKILLESHVFFVGISMTDRNIVGSLLSPAVQQKRSHERFLLVSPDRRPVAGPSGSPLDPEEDREFDRYSRLRTKAIANHLGVTPIFLNSLAQNSQMFVELSCARDNYKKYMKPDSDIRYGRRLIPYVNEIHTHVGLRDANGQRTWRVGRQRKISETLRLEVERTIKPTLGKMARDIDHDEARGHEFSDLLLLENFALYLWARRPLDEHNNPEYSLELVGCSAYVHHESWSTGVIADISAESAFPAGQAVYFGNALMSKMDTGHGQRPVWKTIFACPVNVVVGPAEVTCGSITLNSTLPICEDGRSSVLGQLRSNEKKELADLLQQIGVDAFPS